jgi:hypothetical protein
VSGVYDSSGGGRSMAYELEVSLASQDSSGELSG